MDCEFRKRNLDRPAQWARIRAGRVAAGMLSAGCLLAALASCGDAGSAALPPDPTVVIVSPPLEREFTEFVDFTGRTDAVESVEIRSRVTGFLEKVAFEPGTEVKQGELLFEIDAREFKADLQAADAQTATALAQQLKARADLDRQKVLREKGVNTPQDLDEAVATMADADAKVETARAQRTQALLKIEFSQINAPIAGRISRAYLTKGNLVTADTSLLTTIVSLDPIYADYDVDERTMLELRRRIREGLLPVRAKEQVPILLGVANEQGFPHRGTLDFVDNRVDSQTGTIRVRGVFANPEIVPGQRPLAPGLFARIRLPLGEPQSKLMVTERALGSDQGQKFLFVVDDKHVVQFRPVRVGALEGGLRVIEDGLQKGEQVIIDGLQRVRRGAIVAPQPGDMLDRPGATPPTASAKPGESGPVVTGPQPGGAAQPPAGGHPIATPSLPNR